MGFRVSMTKEEFEKRYANNSDLTIEEVHNQGFYVEPCDCGHEKCNGWQMVFKKNGDTFYNIDGCSVDNIQ